MVILSCGTASTRTHVRGGGIVLVEAMAGVKWPPVLVNLELNQVSTHSRWAGSSAAWQRGIREMQDLHSTEIAKRVVQSERYRTDGLTTNAEKVTRIMLLNLSVHCGAERVDKPKALLRRGPLWE